MNKAFLFSSLKNHKNEQTYNALKIYNFLTYTRVCCLQTTYICYAPLFE